MLGNYKLMPEKPVAIVFDVMRCDVMRCDVMRCDARGVLCKMSRPKNYKRGLLVKGLSVVFG